MLQPVPPFKSAPVPNARAVTSLLLEGAVPWAHCKGQSQEGPTSFHPRLLLSGGSAGPPVTREQGGRSPQSQRLWSGSKPHAPPRSTQRPGPRKDQAGFVPGASAPSSSASCSRHATVTQLWSRAPRRGCSESRSTPLAGAKPPSPAGCCGTHQTHVQTRSVPTAENASPPVGEKPEPSQPQTSPWGRDLLCGGPSSPSSFDSGNFLLS